MSWKVARQYGRSFEIRGDDEEQLLIATVEDIQGVGDRRARLMAAAPDLYLELKALIALLEAFDADDIVVLQADDDPHALTSARAAIAKAEGGAS